MQTDGCVLNLITSTTSSFFYEAVNWWPAVAQPPDQSYADDWLWIASWLLRCCHILGKYKVQVQSEKWSSEFTVEQTVPTSVRRWWGAAIRPSFFSSHCTWVRKKSVFIKVMGWVLFVCLFVLQLIQCWTCFTVRRLEKSFIGNQYAYWCFKVLLKWSKFVV